MTDEELTRRFDALDKRFEGVATKKDLEQFATKLDLDQMAARVRDHFNLIAESLKADIKVIAEGHRALRATDLELIAELRRVDKRQDHLEVRQLALEMKRRTFEEE